MQAYLPLTSSELLAPCPPSRIPSRPDDDEATPDSLEDARDEAAWRSLVLTQEVGGVPTRLVASGDLDAGVPFTSWEQVDELYADDVPGRDLARDLLAAKTQESADTLMEQLFAESLMWFDTSERESLGNALMSSEQVDEV